MTIVDAEPKLGQVESAQLLFREARQRRRKRWIISGVVAVALVVLASALTALTILPGSPSAQHVSRAPSPVAPLPMDTALTWGPPVQLTSGEGALWVTHGAASPLHTVPSPTGNGGVVRISVGAATPEPWAQVASPDSSAVFDGSLWTAGFNTGSVTRIDTHTGRVLSMIALPPPPSADSPFPYPDGQFLPDAIAASHNGVWVISARGYAAMIDPSTNQVVRYFRLTQDAPSNVVADSHDAWVAEGSVGIAHLSSVSPVQVVQLHVDGRLGDVADVLFTQGSLWASGTVGNGLGSPYEGFVARFNPSTGEPLAVKVLSDPLQLMAKTNTAIWTTNGRGHLFLVRPIGQTGLRIEATRTLGIRNGLFSFAGTNNRLWFIAGNDDVVTELNPATGAMVKVKV
jgi:hypothetical protein